jgi:hypothetical protein
MAETANGVAETAKRCLAGGDGGAHITPASRLERQTDIWLGERRLGALGGEQ